MVVDDESEVRNAICNYFPWSTIAFEVVGQADNGREAFDFLRDNPVDVILCDIRMPVMSGIDLAQKCGKSIKIVFISAYRDFEYAQKALTLGVKDYIVKPCKYDNIVEVFSKIKAELDEERHQKTYGVPGCPVASDEKSNDGYNMKIISIVKNYVNEHFKEATLEQAAELVHMSPNYLSVFFKNKTGQNFSNFITEIRMQKAAELLKGINYKVYNVSEMVGYSNSKNFCRAFKNYYKKSPKEYRNTINL